MFLFPMDVAELLMAFLVTCKMEKPLQVTHHFIQLYVMNPFGQVDLDLQSGWFKEPKNQLAYNKQIWQILKDTGMLPKVRRVIREDVSKSGTVIAGQEYGDIVLKSHGKDLLDCFLKSKPDNLWV